MKIKTTRCQFSPTGMGKIKNISNTIVVVQSLSCVQLFVTPWTVAHQAPLSSQSLLKFMSIESVMYPVHWLIHVNVWQKSPQYCGYLTISSSAVSSYCLHSFPASGSSPMSWLFTSGDQSIGVSASASVLPMNIQG